MSDEEDILGGSRRFYPSGQLLSYIKKDGSGIVHYPDGRIAVNIVAGDGIPPGLYTTFFRHKGKKDVLGSWSCRGEGSMMYKSGKVMISTTLNGGAYYDEDGNCLRRWTWDKNPLKDAIDVKINDFLSLNITDRQNIRCTFKAQDKVLFFELGQVMRRSDTYLDKVIGTGRGNERGKLFLDVEKCRDSLSKTQVLRDTFKAAKVDPVMPKEGTLDPRVVELANNPSKVTTESIRNQIKVITTITTENAGALHALPYIEHEVGEDGKRRPKWTEGVDKQSTSYKLQQKMAKGWKCILPRADSNSEPVRAPVLMGGRFETCTRFAPYFTKKVKLPCLKSSEFDSFIKSVSQAQVVMVVCVSAASPNASSKALALMEDVNGIIWERYGDMDLSTRKCSKSADQIPFRMMQFDIAESRLLADRHNIKSVPMYLIYFKGKLVYASNTFTKRYDAMVNDHHLSLDRMYEPVLKKAFGLTTDDVMRTLEQAKSDGVKGNFLPHDLKFGAAPSSLGSASALAKIMPYPSPNYANQKKKPLLRSVVCEPTAVDGILSRMEFTFGKSGKVET